MAMVGGSTRESAEVVRKPRVKTGDVARRSKPVKTRGAKSAQVIPTGDDDFDDSGFADL